MMSIPMKSYLCHDNCCNCSKHKQPLSDTLLVLNDATWQIPTIKFRQAYASLMKNACEDAVQEVSSFVEDCPDVTKRTTSPSRMCGPNTGFRPSLAIYTLSMARVCRCSDSKMPPVAFLLLYTRRYQWTVMTEPASERLRSVRSSDCLRLTSTSCHYTNVS